MFLNIRVQLAFTNITLYLKSESVAEKIWFYKLVNQQVANNASAQ